MSFTHLDGPWPSNVKQLRLWSGLILVTYLVTHFSNHALGLISVGAAEVGRWWFVLLWRNPLGTLVLYAALITHPILGFVALYRRRTLRMPVGEAVQQRDPDSTCIPGCRART